MEDSVLPEAMEQDDKSLDDLGVVSGSQLIVEEIDTALEARLAAQHDRLSGTRT